MGTHCWTAISRAIRLLPNQLVCTEFVPVRHEATTVVLEGLAWAHYVPAGDTWVVRESGGGCCPEHARDHDPRIMALGFEI